MNKAPFIGKREIFLASFNHALNESQGDEKRTFQLAWSAMEWDYEKDEHGQWHKKDA